MPFGAMSGIGAALIAGVLVGFSLIVDGLNLWPMPASVSYGSRTLYFSKDLQLRTEGSNYSDVSGILKDGFSRMIDVIQTTHVVDGNVPNSGALHGLHVQIFSLDDELNFGTDETYKLLIPASGEDTYAYVEAQTVYGALHAFETFSQLCIFNFNTRIFEIHSAPWKIVDGPRFTYRGLLIDTSRHFLPLPIIKKVIDSMSFTKLNVLHWHIVDRESFPIQTPSYPNLWKGAYSYSERYTVDDAQEIVQYAKSRGINVLAEIDVPGHARSWGFGYPSLWPAVDCREPLDVSKEFAFQVLDGILSDFKKIFKFKFVHLGGDEVNTTCWTITPHISKWLKEHEMNASDAYRYFVLRAQKIALSHDYEFINWEETFNNFGEKLSRKTVIHNWLGRGVAEKVVAAGLRCIVSNQDKWYLDHLDATWDGFYLNEPLENITNPEQQELVLGGEVCMWGEFVDASDIEQTIWPRAAAAAERLWSPIGKLATDPNQVAPRLAHFRCLLNQRGVAAAPLFGHGRSIPPHQDSCLRQ